MVDGELERNLAHQTSLYGEPLGPLLHRLVESLGVTQARLAQVLGLSAPMLSQLISGRRVKIGNPAVVARLRRLVELVDAGRPLDPQEVERELAQVADSQSPLSGAHGAQSGPGTPTLLEGLRSAASPEQLAAAADAVAPISRELADLLARAAGRRFRG